MRLLLYRKREGINMTAKNLAVIDIGSNSVRLLMRINGAESQRLSTTRLGQGVAERMLQKEPLERTIDVIGRMCAMVREMGCEEIYAFATSAVRDALNKDELLVPVKQRFGLSIDVLPGEVEAQLAYMGAAQGMRACVIDIGGASTELVAGDSRVEKAVSLQVGAVRLKDRCGQDRKAAEAFLDEMYAAQKEAFASYADAPFLGIGGTVTTLAAMERKMTEYDEKKIHRHVLKREAMRAWADRLWDMPVEERNFPGLKPARRDIIAHGVLILERFMTVFDREEVIVSTGDNLHGYLAWKNVE